jgi:5'-nucleotidase|tara:strand:- start:251 stop:688 length:438 start_codon:yes stop_codon:yes gene_type:complete
MKTLFIDMDGVIVDFLQSIDNHPEKDNYKGREDALPDVFLNALPMEHAIDSVGKLLDCGKYEVYIASTAPWATVESLTHKRVWIQKYFGDKLKKRLILTHRKDLLIGDYLIDDRLKNGAGEFKGELLHFGYEKFPNWDSVLKYLL